MQLWLPCLRNCGRITNKWYGFLKKWVSLTICGYFSKYANRVSAPVPNLLNYWWAKSHLIYKQFLIPHTSKVVDITWTTLRDYDWCKLKPQYDITSKTVLSFYYSNNIMQCSSVYWFLVMHKFNLAKSSSFL